MPRSIPSIQSFFPPRAPSTLSPDPPRRSKPEAVSASDLNHSPGDGFDPCSPGNTIKLGEELWSGKRWRPPPGQEYTACQIGDIGPGPQLVSFMGRIANFFDNATGASKRPRAAKGCVKMTLKDDTGVITVRLWYATAAPPIRLGQLCSVYTTHVSDGEHGTLALPCAFLFTSIFPERDRGCRFTMILGEDDDGKECSTPLDYVEGLPLANLMTLQNFMDGGYEIPEAKILVVVKWIGSKKKVKGKNGQERELVNVGVFDHTNEATLSLWGPMTASATSWKPSGTVILFTSPGCWNAAKRITIKLTARTTVDVDPRVEDAKWLRNFAVRQTKKNHVNPEFPLGAFDFQAALASDLRVLYTLADLDDFARVGNAHGDCLIGYLSVLVLELNLVLYHRRNMLMCNECCGLHIYATAASAKCKQCDKPVRLRMNPRVLGTVADETGSVAAGKMVLHEGAWAQLFGVTEQELIDASNEEITLLEQQLLFRRATMLFGWYASEDQGIVGRLCVKEIQI